MAVKHLNFLIGFSDGCGIVLFFVMWHYREETHNEPKPIAPCSHVWGGLEERPDEISIDFWIISLGGVRLPNCKLRVRSWWTRYAYFTYKKLQIMVFNQSKINELYATKCEWVLSCISAFENLHNQQDSYRIWEEKSMKEFSTLCHGWVVSYDIKESSNI